MTLSDILTLGAMGYTKADIDALMEREKPAEETKPETDPKPAAPAQDAQKPAAPAQDAQKPTAVPVDPKPADPPKAAGTEFDRLMKRLDELTAAMQENNRAAAEMGANIINPRAAAVRNIAAFSGYEVKED